MRQMKTLIQVLKITNKRNKNGEYIKMTSFPTIAGDGLGVRLSPNAKQILAARYYLKSVDGKVAEDFPKLTRRVANFLTGTEQFFGGPEMVKKIQELFYQEIINLRLMPSSPILMNAGTASPYCAACYVLPVEDSLDNIMTTLKQAMIIQKADDGVGLAFSNIRGSGSPVAGTGGVASGPLPFMNMYNSASEAVKQGGRRRGALMAVLRIDHPDIMDFIKAKTNIGTFPHFNFSVAVTDAFMNAMEQDETYALIDPKTGRPARSLRAKDVLHGIAECAHRCGDPGMIFIDEVNKHNPLPTLISATNHCGEQPLEPWGVCCLASINLSAHLEDNRINWQLLGDTTRTGVRLLDNAIDASAYPLPENEMAAKRGRKIGLGIMGLAHMLAKMGLPYDLDEAVEIAERLMAFISNHALEASRELAKERGPFPDFDKSVYARRGEPQLRNATRVTVAPTGTISIIASTSSSIESIFAVAYTRKALDGKDFPVIDPVFKEVAEARGIYNDGIAEKVAKTGSVQNIDEVPDDLKAIFKTAYEITAERHVKMQAAIQKHCDNGVSKTVNVSSSTGVKDIEQIFLLAYKLKCKGITIFRRGSRPGVLTAGKEEQQYVKMRPRPKMTFGLTEKFKAGCGSLYIHVNRDDKERPLEIFSSLGKGGGCPAQSEATSRLSSLCLRCGVDPAEIIRQLQRIVCPTACSARAAGKPVDVTSCPDATARILSNFLAEGQEDDAEIHPQDVCIICGGQREPGRCGICHSCYAGGCEQL